MSIARKDAAEREAENRESDRMSRRSVEQQETKVVRRSIARTKNAEPAAKNAERPAMNSPTARGDRMGRDRLLDLLVDEETGAALDFHVNDRTDAGEGRVDGVAIEVTERSGGELRVVGRASRVVLVGEVGGVGNRELEGVPGGVRVPRP